MTKDEMCMAFYGNCEDVDGYYRDGCVWGNDIDIYDTRLRDMIFVAGTPDPLSAKAVFLIFI